LTITTFSTRSTPSRPSKAPRTSAAKAPMPQARGGRSRRSRCARPARVPSVKRFRRGRHVAPSVSRFSSTYAAPGATAGNQAHEGRRPERSPLGGGDELESVHRVIDVEPALARNLGPVGPVMVAPRSRARRPASRAPRSTRRGAGWALAASPERILDADVETRVPEREPASPTDGEQRRLPRSPRRGPPSERRAARLQSRAAQRPEHDAVR
jgi:hypothetical protein